MKCGQETQSDQVFCQSCRADMEKHPVPPSVAVHIPKRNPVSNNVPAYDEDESHNQIVSQYKGVIRWLTLIIAALSILLCLVAAVLLNTIKLSEKEARVKNEIANIGKNYSTIDTGRTP